MKNVLDKFFVGDFVINVNLMGGVRVFYEDINGQFQHMPFRVIEVFEKYLEPHAKIQHIEIDNFYIVASTKSLVKLTPCDLANYKIAQMKKAPSFQGA